MEKEVQKNEGADVKNSVENQAPQPSQQIIVNQVAPQSSNGLGTTGFILALLGIFLCWIPVLGWILWILGLIFSCVGIFKRPRGLAIAGLVLSLLDLILLIALVGSMALMFAAL